ncbi:hypothetical protein NP274_00055 [Pseudomonas phage Koomba boorn-mokiny kep-wari Wadjak 1]|nr:hypothetical protein NP274_00055 [Pseudomonas phage Koomba boorn-mokiny kep-wari Wadjak 1]
MSFIIAICLAVMVIGIFTIGSKVKALWNLINGKTLNEYRKWRADFNEVIQWLHEGAFFTKSGLFKDQAISIRLCELSRSKKLFSMLRRSKFEVITAKVFREITGEPSEYNYYLKFNKAYIGFYNANPEIQ